MTCGVGLPVHDQEVDEVPKRAQRREDAQQPERREQHPDFHVGTQENSLMLPSS